MFKLSVIPYSKFWLAFSTLLVVLSLVFITGFGLNLGIDFTGGSLSELKTQNTVEVAAVRTALQEKGFDAVVQLGEENTVLIRTRALSTEEYVQVVDTVKALGGETEEVRFESIGPIVGKELQRKSLYAVVLLTILILLYVAYTFRKVSEPVSSWKYGVLTVVTALHDIIVPLGVFAVLGKLTGMHVDTTVIAALLTILGYSINDTIVVFDRTRENLVSNPHGHKSFAEIVDASIQQTFARSINTSFTTLLVLLAIYFFGGETTQPFVLTLIIGVIAGAYSSIFIASPLLVMWQSKSED